MELNKFLESDKSSKEFIEDVISSVITNVTDTKENPIKHPTKKIDNSDVN